MRHPLYVDSLLNFHQKADRARFKTGYLRGHLDYRHGLSPTGLEGNPPQHGSPLSKACRADLVKRGNPNFELFERFGTVIDWMPSPTFNLRLGSGRGPCGFFCNCRLLGPFDAWSMGRLRQPKLSFDRWMYRNRGSPFS